MSTKCHFSQLVIPSDPAYAAAASKYATEIARIIGFDSQDIQSIASGLNKAIAALIQYSFEPGTSAEPLGDPVLGEGKQARWEQLMALQQTISLERNQSLVGRSMDVLIEGQGDGISIGRSYRDAPEIDGLVIIEGDIPVGDLVTARISGAMAYDLTAVIEGGKHTGAGTPRFPAR